MEDFVLAMEIKRVGFAKLNYIKTPLALGSRALRVAYLR